MRIIAEFFINGKKKKINIGKKRKTERKKLVQFVGAASSLCLCESREMCKCIDLIGHPDPTLTTIRRKSFFHHQSKSSEFNVSGTHSYPIHIHAGFSMEMAQFVLCTVMENSP